MTPPWPMTRPRNGSRKTSPTAPLSGVKGTPTFFLNGEMLTLQTEEQFRQLLADAAK